MEFVSIGCTELTGYRPEELVRNTMRSYADLIHPEDRKTVWDRVQEALTQKRTFEIEYRLVTREGHWKHVWEKGVGVFDHEQLLFLEGFISDITDRKMAGDELRKERDVLKELMETSPAGITVVDGRGNVVFANCQAEKILGLKSSGIMGRTYDDPAWKITDPEGRPFPQERLPFEIVRRTGEPVFGVEHAIE